MRILNRVAASAAGRMARIGCVALVLGLAFGAVPAARASTLNPSLLPNVEAATFEVVAAKPTHHTVTYAKPLPMNLVPYQQRTDKYRSIGTAFAIGPNRYVTAGHVLRAGLNSLWGPLELRDSKGHVYAIGQILKFSLRKDFVVFSLKDPPKHQAVLQVDTHPEINSEVYAVGNALGTGVVIRGGLYTSKTPEDQSGAWDWLRFSAATSPGNSGGPLLNQDGKVIGVVLMMNRDGNLNYALPMSQVLKAPKDMAIANKLIPYGFPLIQDKVTKAFKTRFTLPMTLAQFNATYLKHMRAYEDTSLQAVLEQNASTLFPHGKGSTRQLYQLGWKDLLPTFLHRQENGDWTADAKNVTKFQLDDNGFVRVGVVGKNILFHLHKPDDVSLAKLYGNPAEMANLLMKTGTFTRNFRGGSDTRWAKIQVTSLGKPMRDTTYTDRWQRHWRVSVWPMPFANHMFMVFALPVPDGYAGFIRTLPSSREHDYLINLEAMTNYFLVNYAGTLAQWQAYLKDAKHLPAAFKNIHLSIHYGHDFGYRSKRLKFEVVPRQIKVDPKSWLYLGFNYSRAHGKVVWGVSEIDFDDHHPDGKNWIVIRRNPEPEGDPAKTYHELWSHLLHRRAPFDGTAFPHGSETWISQVAGGKADAKPPVLYAVGYSIDGPHSQKFMKKRLAMLMQGLHVYEH